MKVRVKNCTDCRKQIHKEERELYIKQQYAWLKDGMFTMATLSTAVALVALRKRGRSRAYIRKFFDDMVMLYDTGSVMGKQIVLTDVMKQLETEYDIDFRRIHVNFVETEKEFMQHFKEV